MLECTYDSTTHAGTRTAHASAPSHPCSTQPRRARTRRARALADEYGRVQEIRSAARNRIRFSARRTNKANSASLLLNYHASSDNLYYWAQQRKPTAQVASRTRVNYSALVAPHVKHTGAHTFHRQAHTAAASIRLLCTQTRAHTHLHRRGAEENRDRQRPIS